MNISKKLKKGFTLIEMLIVVAILGILVSVAVPALSSSLGDARAAREQAFIAGVNTALSRYAIAQEKAGNTAATITDLSASADWAKVKDYVTVKGQTGMSWENLGAAICGDGKSISVTGGTLALDNTGKFLEVQPVTAVQCQ